MPADDDALGPAGHQAGDVLADDGLAEHGAAQDVTDSAVGTQPHLLELELCHGGREEGFRRERLWWGKEEEKEPGLWCLCVWGRRRRSQGCGRGGEWVFRKHHLKGKVM